MQWFYPPGDIPETFRGRLAHTKLQFVALIILVAGSSIVWILDMVVLDEVEANDFLGLPGVWYTFLAPLVTAMIPAAWKRENDQNVNPRRSSERDLLLILLLYGAFVGFYASWKAEPQWPGWVGTILVDGILLAVLVMPIYLWIRSKNPYRDNVSSS